MSKQVSDLEKRDWAYTPCVSHSCRTSSGRLGAAPCHGFPAPPSLVFWLLAQWALCAPPGNGPHKAEEAPACLPTAWLRFETPPAPVSPMASVSVLADN